MSEEKTVGKLTVRLEQDTDASNPRTEYDNLGTMVCFHSRYDLGDKHEYKTPEDFLLALAGEHRDNLEDYLENKLWRRIVKAEGGAEYEAQKKEYYAKRKDIIWDTINKHYVILPLGLYDHSGITMYIGSQPSPFDPGGWDSGQVGWIYISKKKAREEYGKGKDTLAKAEEYLRGEVKTFDQYLTGDVYGYIVEDEAGETLDSCWGFFGHEYAWEEGVSAAKSLMEGITKAEEMERNSFAL